MKTFGAEFKLKFNTEEFQKATEAVKKSIENIKQSIKNMGNIINSDESLSKRYVSTSLNAFNTLGKGISRFTSNAIKESARLQNAFTRIPMFLDTSNAFTKGEDGMKKYFKTKNEANEHIYKFAKEYGNANTNKNLSYADIAESYGTFLSGGFDIEDSKAGIKGLSYAMRILPEVDKDTLTNSLINTYNQMKPWFEKNKPELELDEKGSEKKMDHILNTYNAMIKKYQFDLVGGENPFKILTNSLTTNSMGANFDLESLTTLAGTMKTAGIPISQVDTAINNFLLNLPRAERRYGVSLQGKTLTETLRKLTAVGATKPDILKSIFTVRGMKAALLGQSNISNIEAQIKSLKEQNKTGTGYKDDAEDMGKSFKASEEAFNTTTANFQANYGRMGRGFTWMKNDIVSGFLGIVNSSVDSKNIIISSLGNIATYGISSIGSLASAFINYAPAVSAFIQTIKHMDTLKSSFVGVLSMFKAGILGVIPAIWGAVTATFSWAVATTLALAPYYGIIALVAGAVGALIGVFYLFKDSILDAFNALWDFADNVSGGFITGAIMAVVNLIKGVIDGIVWVYKYIKGYFVDVPNITSELTKVEKGDRPTLGGASSVTGSGGGRGRAGKDEFIKGRGYYVQNVTPYSEGKTYSLFPSKTIGGLSNTTSAIPNVKNQGLMSLTQGSKIDIDHDSPTTALAILDTSVVEIKGYVREIVEILKKWDSVKKDKDISLDFSALECDFMGA